MKLTLKLDVSPTPDEIKEALLGYSPELEANLIGDLSHHSMRATYSEDSFAIEEVYEGTNKNSFTLRYSYGWSAHYGCKDMNDGDMEYDEVSFNYRRGVASFDIIEVEPRSTFEEF